MYFTTLKKLDINRLYENESICCELSYKCDVLNNKDILALVELDENIYTPFKRKINKEDIKLIIYPIFLDIIYSCNIDITRSYDFFIKNKTKLNQIVEYKINNNGLLKKIYPSIYETVDLIDRLIEMHNYVSGDIETKYEILKCVKKDQLIELISEINHILKTKLSYKRMVEDEIFVKNLDKKSEIENLDNIKLISKDNKLYKFNSETNNYESVDKKSICKEKVKELSFKR